VRRLGTQPIAAGQPEEPTEPKVGIGGDGAFSRDDLADSLRRDINLLGQSILTDAHGRQELLQQELTGRNCVQVAHDDLTLVIIDDLDIERTGLRPAKADSPLIVDPDAVLAGSSAFQGFESIARRYFQIVQAGSDLKLPQLAPGDRLDVHEPPDPDSFREPLGVRAFERSDHAR
jgi:hypothetical protein